MSRKNPAPLSSQEIDDIRWTVRRLREYGREVNGVLDRPDDLRCDRIEQFLYRFEHDTYTERPPANAEQLRKRNENIVLNNLRRETTQFCPWPWLAPPDTWAQVEWPSWVPEQVQKEVAEFWCEAWGRSPRAYEAATRSISHTQIPAFGERVRLRLISREQWCEGRYVHSWNNIGRVVDDAGRVHMVSTIDYTPPVPAEATS